jgi:3-dehydroquinate synthase
LVETFAFAVAFFTWYNGDAMPIFMVKTPQHAYPNVVERGVIRRIAAFIPQRAGKLFVVTTEDVWRLHAERLQEQLAAKPFEVLFFPGGEANKRLAAVEVLAEQMMNFGADRGSMVIGFGGGIVTDVSGFLAAIFMRGIPVLQVPTTLLAQVDAGTGGKTGVNLVNGKNLIGSFHQPTAVLIDPDVLSTLPAREYRAGLFEVIKCGVIRDRAVFDLLEQQRDEVLTLEPAVSDRLIAAAVRIKAEVVTADEREGDLRRILNFGHTIGHAIEAETAYVRLLHGEAVGWGMLAATRLAELTGTLKSAEAERIARVICSYGPLPAIHDLDPDRLLVRLASDKKTLQGKIHFVLPTSIGAVTVMNGIDPLLIRQATTEALQRRS